MTNEQKAKAIDTLRANLDNLDDWGRNFAGSLLGYWDERGDLTDKQWGWVLYLSGTGPKPGGGQRRWNGRRSTQGPKAKGPSQAEAKLREAERRIADLTRELEQAKRESQQASDPRWEAMVAAFARATESQRKLVMRSMHPDKWGGAEWATKVFQAANK